MTEKVASGQSLTMGMPTPLIASRETATGAPPFAKIYEAEFDYVWRALRRLGVAGSDLEDLAHDTFAVVWRRLGDYDPARPLRPWLFGIAYRIACAHQRRFPRSPAAGAELADLPSERPGPDEDAAAAEARSLVLRALGAIDLDQRATFIMHEIDGGTAPEIAASLGIPLNTVYSRLRLGRQKFAAAIAAFSRPQQRNGE